MYENLIYQGQIYKDFLINKSGEILNQKTNNMLKPYLHKSGYYCISLPMGKRGSVKLVKIHKALAETFIPNPKNLPVVNHIDENKGNYSLENLEWVTHGENTRKHLEILSQKNYFCNNRKLTEQNVRYIRQNREKISAQKLADKFNCSKTTIIDVQKYRIYKFVN